MAVDLATFRTRFPEFSDDTEYPDATVQLFLDDAQQDIGSDENRWCGKYDRAHAYLAAHLLTVGSKTELGDSSSSAGTIQSKSAGGVSVSRAVAVKSRSDADEFYMTTSYGQSFVVIRNGCFIGVLVANKT